MREYKFRGKCLDSGEWVYGDLRQVEGRAYILDYDIGDNGISSIQKVFDIIFEVAPETVGQLTPVQDRQKNPIYEGDVIKNHTPAGENHSAYDEIGVVIWDKTRIIAEQKRYGKYFPIIEGKSEVIGNIYEHPHLLKE